MKVSKSCNESPKGRKNLRNFRLSVEEIKITRAIGELTQSLKNMESEQTQPERAEIFRNKIRTLEEELEEIRDNTLIR